MTFANYFQTLIPMLLLGCIFWLISMVKRDVSIVDSIWSLFFIFACLASYMQLDSPDLRAQIVVLLVFIWGLRLSLYITLRHWGEAEDHRYQQIRHNNQPNFSLKSLYLIFILQALLAWIISLPIFFAVHANAELGYFDWLGIILWLTGMYFESIGDFQLWKFKKNSQNKGKIYTRGLWSYTRHPNYFGEFLIWWGYFCLSLNAGAILVVIAVISPLIMTFLLMKFSGVALLERTMKKRPGYEDYMHNTNAFFPAFTKYSAHNTDSKKVQS